jgi:hypothetical protein
VKIGVCLQANLEGCKTIRHNFPLWHKELVGVFVDLESYLGRLLTCGKLRHNRASSLYTSPNVIKIIQTVRVGWVGRIARMREKRNVYKV